MNKKRKYKNRYINSSANRFCFQKKYIISAIIIIIVLLVIITTKTLTEKRDLNPFEKVIKDSAIIVSDVFCTPFRYIAKQADILKEKNDIYEKYQKLKEKTDKLDSYYVQVLQLQDEIEDMKKALVLNNVLSDYNPINANISNRNVGEWYNTITIDKGSRAKIKKNDAVVVSSGLIGKVIKVGNYTSTVKLLTTEKLGDKISVKIKLADKDVYGLLSGYDKKTNTYTLEGISDAKEIEISSYVTTTGLSQTFPAGILVGKVESVESDEYDLTKIVKVTPSVDFNDINIVTVLKRGVK